MNHQAKSNTIYIALQSEQSQTFPHETNDCTVKALAAATGVSYLTAHDLLAKRGRKIGKGFNSLVMIEEIQKLGKEVKDVGSLIIPHTKTVRAFGARNYKGTYLIRTKGHILCSKNGVVQDWTVGRCHRILNVWRVDEKKQVDSE